MQFFLPKETPAPFTNNQGLGVARSPLFRGTCCFPSSPGKEEEGKPADSPDARDQLCVILRTLQEVPDEACKQRMGLRQDAKNYADKVIGAVRVPADENDSSKYADGRTSTGAKRGLDMVFPMLSNFCNRGVSTTVRMAQYSQEKESNSREGAPLDALWDDQLSNDAVKVPGDGRDAPALHLLKAMLQLDPSKRISCQDALKHNYFANVAKNATEKLRSATQNANVVMNTHGIDTICESLARRYTG